MVYAWISSSWGFAIFLKGLYSQVKAQKVVGQTRLMQSEVLVVGGGLALLTDTLTGRHLNEHSALLSKRLPKNETLKAS